MSAFQGEVYTGRIGPIVGTLGSVRIIEVSAFQGCPQGGVPLYIAGSSKQLRLMRHSKRMKGRVLPGCEI